MRSYCIPQNIRKPNENHWETVGKDLEFKMYITIVNAFQDWLKWSFFLIQAVSLLDFHDSVVYIPRYH